MKKLFGLAVGATALISTAALAADLTPVYKAAPAVQQQPISGYVGLYVGGDWASYGLTDPEFANQRETSSAFLFGGEGRLNWWLDPNWAVQLDVEGEGTGGLFRSCDFDPTFCEREARYAGTVGGHVAYRVPQRYAIGAFGGSTATNLLDFDGGMSYGFGGLEAQVYLGMLTLYGQGGFFGRWAGVKDQEIIDGYFLRGVARYFFTPDDRLSGSVEYASGAREDCPFCFSPSTGGRQNILLWTAAYEHRFAGKPLSVFVGYEGMNYQDSLRGSDGRVEENKVMAGVRLYVNENTLAYNDRNGATWDMPKFLKTLSWGDVSVEGGNFLVVSDIRLKRDIVRVGELDNGLGLYRYRYLWSDTEYVGVMAQEVAEKVPGAAIMAPDGYLRVDYGKLGLHLMTAAEWESLTYQVPDAEVTLTP